MVGPASLLLGISATLSFFAASILLCRYIGAASANLLLAALGASLAGLACGWTPQRSARASRTTTLFALLAAAALCLIAPAWLNALARVLADHGGPEVSGLALAVIGAGAIGPLVIAHLLALRCLGGSTIDARRPTGWFLIGAAIGAIIARAVIFDLAGVEGGVRLAAVLAAISVAFIASDGIRPLHHDPPTRTPERVMSALRRLVFATLTGVGVGVALRMGPMTAAGRHAASYLIVVTSLAAAGIATLGCARWIAKDRPAHADLTWVRLLAASAAAIGVMPWLSNAWQHADPSTDDSSVAALLALFIAATWAAAVAGRDLHAPRIPTLIALAMVTATLVRLSPADPYGIARFTGHAGVALAVAAVATSRRRRATLAVATGAGLLLAVAWWITRPAEPTHDQRYRLRGWEREGSAALEVHEPLQPWHETDNARPIDEDIDSRALRRLLLIALALEPAPQRALVLGAGAHRFADAALDLARADVTWVTPRRGDTAIAAAEPAARLAVHTTTARSFLERSRDVFDLIVVAPSDDPIERGLERTAEFHRQVVSHLSEEGLAIYVEPLAAMSEVWLQHAVLKPLISTLPETILLVDHPRSPNPLLGILTARSMIALDADRIAGRLEELGQNPIAQAIISAADLDVRGALQCYLMDREIVRLYVEESESTDARPWLAGIAANAESGRGALRWLMLRRAAGGARLGLDGDLDPVDAPVKYALSGRLRHDFEATNQLIDGVVTAIEERRTIRDPEAPPSPTDDLNPYYKACMRSPYFPLARGPLERAVNDRIQRRRLDDAVTIALRLYQLDPSRLDLKLLAARLQLRAGRVVAAIDSYRQILDRHPGHVGAHYELGLLLASRGAADRRGAIPHLRRSLRDAALGDRRQRIAEVVLAFVINQKDAARTMLTDLPPHQDDVLLDYIRRTLGE